MSKYASREQLFESYQTTEREDWDNWVLSLCVNPKQIKLPLYHISFNASLPSHVKPREPYGGSGNPHPVYHEPVPARVSTSPTIQGCFAGIYANFSDMFEKDADTERMITFNIYRVFPNDDALVLTPKTAQAEWLIYDAHVTHEHCVFGECRLENIGTWTIENKARAGDEDWIIFHPFGIKKYEPIAACFTIEEVIESQVKYSPLLYSKPLSVSTEARQLCRWLNWG